MLNRRLPACLLIAALITFAAPLIIPAALAQDQPDTTRRGRKYTPPPETAHISVTVLKETNNKPVSSAAVIFHIMEGADRDKGNMELKTNEEGKAIIDVIPIGKTVRLQVIANGFQTFGDDYKIIADSKEIVVKLKRPARQYSTYEHPETQPATPASTPPSQTPK